MYWDTLSKSPYKLLLTISQHAELFLTQRAENYTDLCLNKTNNNNKKKDWLTSKSMGGISCLMIDGGMPT